MIKYSLAFFASKNESKIESNLDVCMTNSTELSAREQRNARDISGVQFSVYHRRIKVMSVRVQLKSLRASNRSHQNELLSAESND